MLGVPRPEGSHAHSENCHQENDEDAGVQPWIPGLLGPEHGNPGAGVRSGQLQEFVLVRGKVEGGAWDQVGVVINGRVEPAAADGRQAKECQGTVLLFWGRGMRPALSKTTMAISPARGRPSLERCSWVCCRPPEGPFRDRLQGPAHPDKCRHPQEGQAGRMPCVFVVKRRAFSFFENLALASHLNWKAWECPVEKL